MNRRKKVIIVFCVLFAVLLAGQLFVQNRFSIFSFIGGYEKKEIPLSALTLSKGKEYGSFVGMGSDSTLSVYFDEPAEVRSLYVKHGEPGLNQRERFFAAELMYELEKVPGKLYSAGKINCYNEDDLQFLLRAGGAVTRILVKLGDCSSYNLSAVTVNGGFGFRFSASKFFLWASLLLLVFAIVYFELYKKVFDPRSRAQKRVFVLLAVILVLFSFLVCAVSIERDWTVEYPLERSVDDYGCYIQLFDAFKKGQCNIDTDFDLELLSAMKNPYDYHERKEVMGEPYGPIWDRAFYDGKLYSYFGAAPVVYLYFPFFFLTGRLPSDALAAAIIAAATCVMMLMLLWELCQKYTSRLPLWLMLFAGTVIPFGSLVFVTQTNANFYHIAVMSGIFSVCGMLWAVFRAIRTCDGVARKLFFALAGIFVASAVASRPSHALYVVIALPVLFEVLKKHPFGTRSLIADVASFCVPMMMLGGLIMAYNHARFGSVFDFGNNYQLTLTDTSTYNASLSMLIPAVLHYYFQFPSFNGTFPYLHPYVSNFEIYGSWTYLYNSIGTAFLPATWGNVALLCRSRGDLTKRLTFIFAMVAAFAVAFVDMCFGGVHLRYAADIMFVMMIFGTFLLLLWVDSVAREGKKTGFACTAVFVILLATLMVSIPLALDNERDMIMKYHADVYRWLM